jgi:hypothetical protein
MTIATWLLLTSGISVVVGTGLSLFVQSLVSYKRWQRAHNQARLCARKAELEQAATKITSFIAFDQLYSNLDNALAAYELDPQTLTAVKAFLQTYQEEASTTQADYADLFNEVREILANYETNRQRASLSQVIL